MSDKDSNIITLKLQYEISQENKDKILWYMKEYNKVLKCTYNYLKKNPKSSTSEISHYQNSLNNINIDTHFKGSAIYNAKSLLEKDKVIFGGKKLFFDRMNNKISKEEFQIKKLLPIYRVGASNVKGNSKFEILSDTQILFKPSRNEHFILDLKSIGKNYQKYLNELKILANNKQIALDFKLDLNYIYLSFDLSKLKSEIKPIKKIQDRYFSIDMNPNYIGYTVIDWKSSTEYEIIDKGAFSLKLLNDYDNSLKGKGFNSESKERKYISNKRNYEVVNVAHKLTKIANHYRCCNFVIEDLSIKQSDKSKGRKFNKLCNNQWCRNVFVNQIRKTCKIYEIQLLEVIPNYSSFIGNLVYRNERLPDFVLSSIEISRRGYEWNHQYVLKDKNKEKNIVFGNFEKDKNIYKQSLEELNVDVYFDSFQELYDKIKKSKVRYRFPLESCSNLVVFRKKHIKTYQTLYKFV